MVWLADKMKIVVTGLVLACLAYCAQGCGLETYSLKGILKSPNYPYDYPNDMSCVYIIRAPPNYRVTLTLVDVHMEYERTCRHDYLEFREGDSATSQLLGSRHCRLNIVKRMRSFGSVMRVHFVSNGQFTSRGFYATFESAPLEIPFLLVTHLRRNSVDTGDIYRVDPETGNNILVLMPSKPSSPTAVDYDPVSRQVFYIESVHPADIWAVSLDGGQHRVVMSAGNQGSLAGLAVDAVSRLLFYTDAATPTIGVWNMTSLSAHTLLRTGLREPHAIVVSPADRILFWTDKSRAMIERASYDGSDRRTCFTSPSSALPVTALALDDLNKRLYWVGTTTDRIETSDMDGGDRKVVVQLSRAHRLFDLALIQDTLYMTDRHEVSSSEYEHTVIRVDNASTFNIDHKYSAVMYGRPIPLYAIRACFPPGFNISDTSWRTTQQPPTPPAPGTRQPPNPSRDYSFPSEWPREPSSSSRKSKKDFTTIFVIGGVGPLLVILSVVVVAVVRNIRGRRPPSESTDGFPDRPTQGYPPDSGVSWPRAELAPYPCPSYPGSFDHGQPPVSALTRHEGHSHNSTNDAWDDAASGHDFLVPDARSGEYERPVSYPHNHTPSVVSSYPHSDTTMA